MGFCKRCGELVHGTNCLKCGGRAVSSATSGLAPTGTRNDPWMNMYQNILEGGTMSKTAKRMSMPATTAINRPQPLITQKLCNGCSKQILQAKVFVEPSRPTVIYCEKCYVERFTKGNCPACYKPVMSKTDIFVSHENRSWHKSCFVCFNCRKDVSSSPMVDLRKRPCCEDCLMAQAGSAPSPLSDQSSETLHSASAISPELSIPSSPSPTSTTSSSSPPHSSTPGTAASHTSDPTEAHRLHLHLSPLDLNLDTHTNTGSRRSSSPAPLSYSSSNSSNYRRDFLAASGGVPSGSTGGYASGASSTYSSLGRRHADDFVAGCTNVSASAEVGSTSASLFVKDEVYPTSSLGGGSGSGWRSNSSLSNHSQHNSRASSPFPSYISTTAGADYYARPDSPLSTQRAPASTVGRPGLYRTRSRSFGGHGSALHSRSSSPRSIRSSTTSSSSGLYRSDSQMTNASSSDDATTTYHANSRPTTPLAHHKTAGLSQGRQFTVAADDREQPLLPKTEDPKLARGAYREQHGPSPAPRPGLYRTRSRSFAAAAEKSGLVRARTEALMAANNSSSSSLSPVSPVILPSRSSIFSNASSTLTVASATNIYSNAPLATMNRPSSPAAKAMAAVAKTGVSATDKDAKLAPPLEDERPSYYRHGRQRSNTVGEAVTFPAVSVASSTPGSPPQRRSSMQPESGSCLKCFEKVVENGVKLPNGDRYHIHCFLCTGCKQIFTESEFHIVNGRPYHPHCSVMAGPTSTMSATTKCAKCFKLINKRTIRFGGLNYHPQCFTCSHCGEVLQSTSKFFEVDGKVECGRCCEEKDKLRLPQMVPLPRSTEPSFPTAGSTPLMRRQSQYGTSAVMTAFDMNHPAAASQDSLNGGAGVSTPHTQRSGSPTGSPIHDFPSSLSQGHMNGGMMVQGNHRPQSPTIASSPGSATGLHPSPVTPRADPPVLTSLFSTRTRPLPKFGGTVTCPRCKQPIGVMDQTPGPKGDKWHKKCLTCKGCKKVLDSSALTRGEGEAYCRACYNKATKA